jgi:hypothetical protein
MPRTLADVKVGRDKLDMLAQNSLHDRWVRANPEPLTKKEQVMEILEMVVGDEKHSPQLWRMNIFLTFSMDASEAAGSADIVEILCSADGALQFESIIAEIEMLERVDAVFVNESC